MLLSGVYDTKSTRIIMYDLWCHWQFADCAHHLKAYKAKENIPCSIGIKASISYWYLATYDKCLTFAFVNVKRLLNHHGSILNWKGKFTIFRTKRYLEKRISSLIYSFSKTIWYSIFIFPTKLAWLYEKMFVQASAFVLTV